MSMIYKAFIQEEGNGRLQEEKQLVVDSLNERSIPITLYTKKHLRHSEIKSTD